VNRENFMGKSLFVLGGLIVWAIHFLVAYPFTSLACVRGWTGISVLGYGIVPFVVIALTVAAIAATAMLLAFLALRVGPARTFRKSDSADEFLRATSIAVAGLALVSIAWNGLPALLLPPCG
jgi:hypothetical protein